MIKKTLKLKKIEVTQLFEEFNTLILKEGVSAKYSLFVYNNAQVLMPIWEQIAAEIYDERREPEFPKFIQQNNDIITKYADRDEQGNIVKDQNGQPMITEQIVEFNTAVETLNSTYKEMLERIAQKDEINKQVYLQEIEVELTCLDIDEFPANTKPFVVGILNSGSETSNAKIINE